MESPVQITFRSIERSAAIENYVRERARKLGTFFARMIGCHVTLDAPHRHQRHGRPYDVRIDITVPGVELFAGRSPAAGRRHADVYAAIDDAFDDAGRMLRDHARKRGAIRRRTARTGAPSRDGDGSVTMPVERGPRSSKRDD
jgi:ribosomal subunit interface protein